MSSLRDPSLSASLTLVQNKKLIAVFDCVTEVWGATQATWESDPRNPRYEFVHAWREIIRDQMQHAADQAETWVSSVLAHLQVQFNDVNTLQGRQVREIVTTFRNAVADGLFEIPTPGYD